MRRTTVAVVILAVLGAACAAVDQPKTPRLPDEFRLSDGTLVVCRMEATTGSNFRERVCRKVEGTSPEKQSALSRTLSPPRVNTSK